MALFGIGIFISSFMLFQVQLVLSKFILPWFGGAPSVWTTCMLFFQVFLLAGYSLPHLINVNSTRKRQIPVYLTLLLLSIGVLIWQLLSWGIPLLPSTDSLFASFLQAGVDHPVAYILLLLSISVGLPYLLLSTTSPLLQSWYHRVKNRPPYRLYSLSNAGSLIGLVSYPFLIERLMDLEMQAKVWFSLFVLYAVILLSIILITARTIARNSGKENTHLKGGQFVQRRVSASEALLWIGLAATASTALLAFTNQMCQEISVIPFLWVLPLSLYLVSFIITFSENNIYRQNIFAFVFAVLSLVTTISLIKAKTFPVLLQIALFSCTLFSLCMICHGELAHRRPHPERLTSFYLCIAVGGALGGLFVNFVAPVLFDSYWELHLSMLSCALFLLFLILKERRTRLRTGHPRMRRVLLISVPAALTALLAVHSIQYHENSILSLRNFYGVLRIEEKRVKKPPSDIRFLMHGITTHGFQFTKENLQNIPTCYYGRQSGVGIGLMNHPLRNNNKALRVGAVGLGIGTIASYGQSGDSFTFYEINPQVIDLAKGKDGYFTFIPKSEAEVTIIPGDARLSLERDMGHSDEGLFDILVLDAFSSDSVPVHLLTREAFDLYFKSLRQGGLIAVHASNRTLAIAWIVIRQAIHRGVPSAVLITPGDIYTFSAEWVLITDNRELLALPELAENLVPTDLFMKTYPISLWTDKFSNLFEIVK